MSDLIEDLLNPLFDHISLREKAVARIRQLEAQLAVEQDNAMIFQSTILERAEKAEAALKCALAAHDGQVQDKDYIAGQLAALKREINEALVLTESCSTLKDMASACIDGAVWKDRAEKAEAELAEERAKHTLTIETSADQSEQIRGLRADNERLRVALEYIAGELGPP